MEDVYVTGLGIVSPLGHDTPAFWEALVQGISGVGPVTRFETDWLAAHIAAEIRDFPKPSPFLTPEEAQNPFAGEWLILSAGREALKQAGLLTEKKQSSKPDLEIILGSNQGDFVPQLEKRVRALETTETSAIRRAMVPMMLSESAFHELLLKLARRLNAGGVECILSNACSTGAYAISLAAERIRQGKTEAVLCGGVEILSEVVYAGFSCLRALAPACCQPFDLHRQGIVFGEAAAAFMLESKSSVLARGVQPLAKIAGWGWSSDAHHLSAPHPEGRGMALALQRALKLSGLKPGQIDCLVAHGTGTLSNDRVEAAAFLEVFGKNPPPVTAPKSMVGHSMGAASAVEALVGVKIVERGIIPPTMNFQTPDPDCPLDCVPNTARRRAVTYCQTNASSFGGNNVSIIFGPPEL